MTDFSDKRISRRLFLKTSLAGVASLDALIFSGRPASARQRLKSALPSFPTPIFRIDNVRTYEERIGFDSYEVTSASVIGPDPNPDDPSIAPGYHYYHEGVENLLQKAAQSGYPFWKSSKPRAPASRPFQFQGSPGDDGGFGVGTGIYGGSNGLLESDDIIIIKINGVSPAHCMVNVDILKGLIQRILDHPDGFTGEVIVLDKFFDDSPPNSYHQQNSVSAACNSFPEHRVSRVTLKDFVWHNKIPVQVQNGYVELEILNPDVPELERVSYPKFTTRYGTHIDLKLGWWNGVRYDNDRVKLIGYAVLKDQRWTSVTCCLKNFFGIHNIGTVKFGGSDGDPLNGWHRSHEAIYQSGLLGRLLRYVRFPDLFIVDATRILAQPPLGPSAYDWPPVTPGVLLAGFDPCNLDYYAAKEILLQQPIITPCNDILGIGKPAVCPYDPAIPGYPCSETGQCARHDPDFVSDQLIHPIYRGREGFRMRESPPLDAFRRYLYQSSEQLYGDVLVGPDYYEVF